MSLLRELEQRLESLFEGFFTRQFKSGVQPVEIAKKLSREMDTNRTISVKKVYVPNHYTIFVSAEDLEKLRPFAKTLISELQSFLVAHAKKEGYELVGRPFIELNQQTKLSLGEFSIESSLESRDSVIIEPQGGTTIMKPAARTSAKQAFLVRTGRGGTTKTLLTGRKIGVGRAPDNDIVVADANVSRHHARIEHLGTRYVLQDLGSTNGTFVNGAKVEEQSLKEGDVIVVGKTKLHFRREQRV